MKTNNYQNEFIKIISFIIIKNYLFKINLKSYKSFSRNRLITIVIRQKFIEINRYIEKINKFKKYFQNNF